MTEKTTLGWIGDVDDPGCQLAIESFSGPDVEIVRVEDITRVPGRVDHILITDVHVLIANSAFLIQFDGMITVVLRRLRMGQSNLEWRNAHALIARIISQFDSCKLSICVLTQSAAEEIGSVIGCKVNILKPIERSSDVEVIQGKINSEELEIELHSEGVSAGMLHLDARNWVALGQRIEIDLGESASLDLCDVVEFANRELGNIHESRNTRKRTVIFVVPNGVGLGHLTRLMAVANEMRMAGDVDVAFWCYSFAAYLLENAGYLVFQRRTHMHLHADKDRWTDWESAELARLVKKVKATAVVYDGAVISDALIRALKLPGTSQCGLIWVRRSMWQKRYKTSYLEAAEYCDLIIEPGDLAASADDGPTVTYEPKYLGLSQFARTNPVVSLKRSEMLPRLQARRALGLSRFGTICVLNLGGDAFESHSDTIDHVLHAGKSSGVKLVMVRSPLSDPRPELADRIKTISIYPLAKYLNAFDGIVSAAGYNSFHEALYLTDLPIAFSPTVHARLDNQTARAGFSEAVGWARSVNMRDAEKVAEKFDEFFSDVRRRKKVERSFPDPGGRREMAELILKFVLSGPYIDDGGQKHG